jgi:hypothetical protein
MLTPRRNCRAGVWIRTADGAGDQVPYKKDAYMRNARSARCCAAGKGTEGQLSLIRVAIGTLQFRYVSTFSCSAVGSWSGALCRRTDTKVSPIPKSNRFDRERVVSLKRERKFSRRRPLSPQGIYESKMALGRIKRSAPERPPDSELCSMARRTANCVSTNGERQ